MRWLLVLVAILVTIACVTIACVPAAGPSGSVSQTTPLTSPAPISTPVGSMPLLDATPNPPQSLLPSTITDPILADAATRLGVAAADLILISGEPVTFPDAGLGCSLPDMNYAQVQVDGYKVVIQATGKQLDYRGRAVGDFRLCSQTLVPIQMPSLAP